MAKVFHVKHFSHCKQAPDSPNSRYVSRETHRSGWPRAKAVCNLISVSRETLLRLHKKLALISQTRWHILSRNTQKTKSWDVSSQLPTRRVASARLRLPST